VISDIVKEGILKGFSSVEASREQIIRSEYFKHGDVFTNHLSNFQKIHCRAMYDYGDPVTFMLSVSDKRAIRNVLKLISRSYPSSGKENFSNNLPSKIRKIKIEIYDPLFESIGTDDFTELVDGIDENILNFPELKVSDVSFSKQCRKFYLTNSKGFNAKYRKTHFSVSLKMSLNGASINLSDNRILFSDLEPFKLVSRGYTLLESLTDKQPELKKFNDLVFSPESSSLILKVFSKYFLPMNNKIMGSFNYPTALNISDDPLLNFGTGSIPFDDEGIQKGKTNLIQKGVFLSSITDLRTSFGYDMQTTGNGFRRGGDHPAPGFTNLYIHPSVVSVNSILRDITDTILISLIKLISSKNGEYLFSAYGYRYTNGSRKEPVHFFISTTFQDFLLNIERISKEIRFFYSVYNTGSPYLLLKSKKTGSRIVRI